MRSRMFIALILCLLLVAGTALAAREAVVTRLDESELLFAGAATTRGDACWGNLNDPAYAITDWVWGGETYAYGFTPPVFQCPCPLGFHVESVHMLLQFAPEDVPATFDAYVNLAADGQTDIMPPPCPFPGVEECVSPLFTVTITDPGLYDIALPLYDYCDCAYLEYGYFLSFHIPTVFPETMRPNMITDDLPSGCTSYNDYGLGWDDLVVDVGFPGNIVMWADIICCENPVAVEQGTWGLLKTLYR
jgi:hypothetical protein